MPKIAHFNLKSNFRLFQIPNTLAYFSTTSTTAMQTVAVVSILAKVVGVIYPLVNWSTSWAYVFYYGVFGLGTYFVQEGIKDYKQPFLEGVYGSATFVDVMRYVTIGVSISALVAGTAAGISKWF
jgi:hypothetical protein